jgi:hypothetical protein
MNFVFISPNFPETYYRFCQALKNNGVKVLGVGDVVEANLPYELRNALDGYYYVHDLNNLEEKKNAIRYFEWHYGEINFIESNNEHYLEHDAYLRSEFNVTTGPMAHEIIYFKHKSAMKEKYHQAGVKVARWVIAYDWDTAINFINEVGYPVVAKPDKGVGASFTGKINNEDELRSFFANKEPWVEYIMEEFIDGELFSFDGVCDAFGNVTYPVFHHYPTPIMDIVNDRKDCIYYTSPFIPTDLYEAGCKVVKAFGAKSRFFHLEFFRLKSDKPGLGQAGDIIGLEVNMRVPGGYTPDLVNFAYSVDIYQIWADVITFNENRQYLENPRGYCCYVGRRDGVWYKHSYEDICYAYQNELKWVNRMPDALSGAMGNYFFMARFTDYDKMWEYINYCLEH